MKKIEFDQDDNKWLEDRMLQESQEIKIPESLEPENMLVKLQGVEQKHPNLSWKKSAVIAASFVLVAGVSLHTGRVLERSNQTPHKIEPVQITQETEVKQESEVKETEDRAEIQEEVKKEDVPKRTQADNKKDPVHKKEEQGHLESTSHSEKKIPVSEPRSFVEGDGKRSVTDGTTIYSGEGKEVVIQEYTSNQVKEIARLTVNQMTKEFYLLSDKLVCITSDDDNGTAVNTYDVSDKTEPQEVTTLSVDGNYQCSYQDGDNVYVFTDKGNMQKIDVANNETNTFSVEETDAKYFMAEESVYALTKSEQGTRIQSYKVEDDSLQVGESAECTSSLKNIIAIQSKGSDLELLTAETDGVRIQRFDDQMRLINDKKNSLGEQVFAGEFTDSGILVFSNNTSSIQLNMLQNDSLETKDTVSLEDTESVSIGDLTLTDDGTKFGFVTNNTESKENTYCIYDYSDNSGFSEAKTKQVCVEKVENDFAIGDSVLLADKEGIEILIE